MVQNRLKTGFNRLSTGFNSVQLWTGLDRLLTDSSTGLNQSMQVQLRLKIIEKDLNRSRFQFINLGVKKPDPTRPRNTSYPLAAGEPFLSAPGGW
jgi:hypothetical protein